MFKSGYIEFFYDLRERKLIREELYHEIMLRFEIHKPKGLENRNFMYSIGDYQSHLNWVEKTIAKLRLENQ